MRALEDEGRRQDQLLEVNSLIASAPDPLAASRRILECIADEVGLGPDDEGTRHVWMLCTLLAAAEMQRLTDKADQELADMLDLYHRIRRELREADDARSAADILARSLVPALADVCLVDLAEGQDAFRRAAVETSHLVPDAHPIKAALATLPDRRHAPHDPQVVARTGTARFLTDVSDEDLVCASSTPEHLQALRSLNPTSYLCVPLESSGGTTGPAVGVMTLLRVRPGQAFTDPHKRLAQAIGKVYHDAAQVSPSEARTDRPSAVSPSHDRNGGSGRKAESTPLNVLNLTRREREVLQLMNRGYSREALAKRLNISVKTYDNHTINIRAKLAADSNLAALAKARDAGIIRGD